MNSLFAWIQHYGYAGLFTLLILGIVGLPVPDETLLLFSGYLVSANRLHGWATYLTAFCGSGCGITISYLLGRALEEGFVHRFVKQERIDRVRNWFHKIGDWALFIGYFIPGVRHFTALVAGMSELEYRNFAAYAYPGAAVWSATFITAGYYMGENWRAALQFVHRYTLVFVLVVAVAAAALLIASNIRKR